MKQIVIRFGLMASCLLLLMQIGKYSMVTRQFSDELFFTVFAILFLSFGYVVSRYINSQKNSLESSLPRNNNQSEINEERISKLKISKREYEVLKLINLGHSNQEISQNLFISESTVKSHVSSLFGKLGAKRRTQAIKKAKELEII
jgi:DNA-binding NarL/FixJ family response regulator